MDEILSSPKNVCLELKVSPINLFALIYKKKEVKLRKFLALIFPPVLHQSRASETDSLVRWLVPPLSTMIINQTSGPYILANCKAELQSSLAEKHSTSPDLESLPTYISNYLICFASPVRLKKSMHSGTSSVN